MAVPKKNILVFFYLVAVLGFGISSIFIGRAVADRQKKIRPVETQAADDTECSRHCRLEWDTAYCDPRESPCTVCQGACKLRESDSCETEDGIYMCEECWVPACRETTPTPTPTPAPQPTCLALTSDPEVPRWPETSDLKIGDTISVTCSGEGEGKPVDHYEYQRRVYVVGSGWTEWEDLGSRPASNSSLDYQIVQIGAKQFHCRVCLTGDSNNCTRWGRAGTTWDSEIICTLYFRVGETPLPPACVDLSASSTALEEGDQVDFTCKGTGDPVDHVEFRAQVGGGSWESLGTAPGTKTDGEYEGTISYAVPQTGSYQIECRVCTSADDSQCTLWGKAE